MSPLQALLAALGFSTGERRSDAANEGAIESLISRRPNMVKIIGERDSFAQRALTVHDNEALDELSNPRPPGVGLAELAVLLVAAGVALVGEAFMWVAPIAATAGYALVDLPSLTAMEVAGLAAQPVAMSVASAFLAYFTVQMPLKGRGDLLLGTGLLLVAMQAAMACMRATAWSEVAALTIVPTVLSLGVAWALRRVERGTHERLRTWRRARDRQARVEERLRYAELLDQELAVADAIERGADPAQVRQLAAAATTVARVRASLPTAVAVVLAIVAALFFAGCAEPARPASLTVLVDASPSMVAAERNTAVENAVRAFAEVSGLKRGTEIAVYRDIHLLVEDQVPQRWGSGSVTADRARFVDQIVEKATAELPEGESTVSLGLRAVGRLLTFSRTDPKFVVVVSDLREFRRGRNVAWFFEDQVPKDALSQLEAAGEIPALHGTRVVACGTHARPTEKGRKWVPEDQAAVEQFFVSLVEAGQGSASVLPSCSPAAFTGFIEVSTTNAREH